MSGYEYKTLALPRLLKGPRVRRQSAADFISGVIEEVLNREDEQGWEYLGVQDFSTLDRFGLFGRVEPSPHAVLIFRRARETIEPVRRMMEMRGPAPAEPSAYAPPQAAPPKAYAPPAEAYADPPPVQPYPPRAPAAARPLAPAQSPAAQSPPAQAPAAVPAPPIVAPYPPRAPAPGYGQGSSGQGGYGPGSYAQGARARPAPVDPAAVPVPAAPSLPGAPRLDDDFGKI